MGKLSSSHSKGKRALFYFMKKNKILIFFSFITLTFCDGQIDLELTTFRREGDYFIGFEKYVSVSPESLTDEKFEVALAKSNMYIEGVDDEIISTSWSEVKDFDLSGCKKLKILPALCKLSALKYLFLCNCTGLIRLPDLRNSCVALEILDLLGCTGLPASVRRFVNGRDEVERLFAELKAIECLYVPDEYK
jgi:hypothetical protein